MWCDFRKRNLALLICVFGTLLCSECSQLYLSATGLDSLSCGGNPESACKTLSQALANGAAEVLFLSGHYQWSEYVNITMPELALTGLPPQQAVIDCQNTAGWTLNINQLNVTNLVFSNCVSSIGGALNIVGVDVTLSHLMFFNNTALEAGGALSLTSSGNSVMDDCVFVTNTALNVSGFVSSNDGGAVYASNVNNGNGVASVIISNCDFIANTAYSGGGMYVSNRNSGNGVSTISISNCTFTANTADASAGDVGAFGGGVYIDNNNFNEFGVASVSIGSCNFIANIAIYPVYAVYGFPGYGYGGGMYVSNSNTNAANSEVSVSIDNCHFTANAAGHRDGGTADGGSAGGGIYVDDVNANGYAFVFIDNCRFTANTAYSGGGVGVGLGLGYGVLAIGNCVFISNKADAEGGGFYFTADQGYVTLSSSSFIACTAPNGGAVFVSGTGKLDVAFCDFQQNKASLGGAMQLSDGSTVTVQECTFAYNTATAGGGMFIEDCADVVVKNVFTRGNTAASYGGDILAALQTFLSIQYANFTNAAASHGGSIAVFFSSASLFQSTISDASCASAGAVLIDPSSTLTVSGCVFHNNTAVEHGGAIQVQGTALMNNSVFSNNQGSVGASLYMDSVITDRSGPAMLSCTNCSFHWNHAFEGGACIFWQGTGLEPLCDNCTFAASNTAGYGAGKATPALRLSACVPDYVYTNSSVTVSATLQDYYNQSVVITPVPVLSAVVQQADIVQVAAMPIGSTVATVSVEGLNTAVQLVFQAWTLTSNPVTVLVGECANGYGYTSSRCTLCEAGAYTVNTTAPCQPCSATLTCNRGANVTIQSNYWPNVVSSSGYVEGLLCPYDFCATDNTTGNIFNLNSVCNPTLYRNGTTTMCGECQTGYAEWSHECVPCNGVHGGAIMVQLLQLMGIVLLQRILSQSQSGTTGFVMLVFVYQFADLALYPKPLLQRLLNTFALQLPASSLGCPFPTTPYGELAVQLAMPLVCLALLALLYLINVVLGKLLFVCTKESRMTKFFVITADGNAYIRTLVVLCVNLYETVLEAAFNFLVCTEATYNNINVVYQYPSVSCNDPYYAKVQVILITVIIVVVFAPAVVFSWLHRQRKLHNGSLRHLEERYGRLFVPYKPGLYFWECIALWRRAILLAVFVPIAGRVSLSAAKAVLLACVLVFGAIQSAVKPYKQSRDNRLEMLSLFALAGLLGLFSNDALNITLQSYLGGTLLILIGVVLIAPSMIAAARTALQLFRKRRTQTLKTDMQEQGQLLTPLV
eukprot:TRINITY_DN6283_c0_g1_i3.p1 TRINITY_DN6283_c0_g1~~TRINITY_DN6283_c0_g1_i3.p1  ORF type:complete len:1269 (+),score=299.26 TRINITY_DN6283_c0_g1_i3:256-4062(+)